NPACTAGSSCTVDAGSMVTVSAAVTSPSFLFAGWSGAACPVANAAAATTTLVASGNVVCVATFRPATVTISTPTQTPTAGTGVAGIDNPFDAAGTQVVGTCTTTQSGGEFIYACTVPSGGGGYIFTSRRTGYSLSWSGCAPEVSGPETTGNGMTYQTYVLRNVVEDVTCRGVFTAPPG
ncbi:MAG: hypothetical protein ABW217_08875, partial [Polyangiaceae bacterium]